MNPQLQVNTLTNKPTNIRWYGATLVLFLCFVAYIDRIVFSVSASPIMESLQITPIQFGLITTLFNIGYFIFQIPGAMLIEKKGSRKAMTLGLIMWSIFTAATGFSNSFLMLALVRFGFGVGESPVFTAGNNFFANWFPAKERGKANSMMNGGSFLAPIIGPAIVVWAVSDFGWHHVFYFCGLLGLVAALAWYLLVRDKPNQHPWVNEAELQYIQQDGEMTTKKEKTPWGVFFKKRSFWALAIGYFGTLWTVQFFMYWLPFYLQQARNLSFKDMGFYTSIPFLFIVVGVFFAGTLSDYLLNKGWNKFKSRNMVCITGLTISAISLVLSTFAETAIGNILWLSLALGGAGFAQTLSWSIATDIGRQFTAAVGSWMNTCGFIAASIVPTVAPIIAEIFGWNHALLVNAAVIILGIIGYMLVKTDEPLLADAK